MDESTVRVVVLGAGFGGLTFCKSFHCPGAEVTLIDRTNHHLFQPLLYQVATAGLSSPDIAQPIRSILREQPNLSVMLAEVQDIDLAAKHVVTASKVVAYDYLVIGLGSVTSYFNHPEWEDAAPGIKTLEDALRIRRDLLMAFERAESSDDPAEQQRLMTMVVIGGGPTGVELAGSCAELARHVLKRDFDHIDPTQARVILIEGSPTILSNLPSDLSESAQRQLQGLGVQVLTSHRVKNITSGCVELDDGKIIYAETILWAAGVRAHPITHKLERFGVPLDRGGRVKVNPDLSVPNFPEAFAIGDIISLIRDDGSPVPGVSPAAMQMGRHVARIMCDEIELGPRRRPRPAFHYFDKGTMATIGRSRGVAMVRQLHLHGFVAWLAWLLVHLVFLIGLRNKLAVLLNWTYAYFAYRPGARIVTGWPPSSASLTSKAEQPAQKHP